MASSYEDRILADRAKMRGSKEALKERVAKSGVGPKSKAVLDETLDYESTGHLDFALFAIPPVFERGEGAKLWDVDGKEYIDCHAGFAVNGLGHGNAEVNQAVFDQMNKITQFAELPMRVRSELARRMAEKHPGDFEKKVFFAVTGGEAVEVAVKLARWYTGKPMIITHTGDYHGRTALAQALTSKAFMIAYNNPIGAADAGVTRLPFPFCYRCPWGKEYPSCDIFCAKQLRDQFTNKESPFRNPRAGINNVAAFLIEPFQSSGGYMIPPMEYLQELQNLCREFDILLAIDEVQTGMGRTGKMWASEHAGLEPDLIMLAKSISNGLPISMVTGRAEIMDSWGPGAHSSTFTGYPAACAGGVKVLDIFERDHIVEQAAAKGEYFLDGLRDLADRHPMIGHYNGKGLWLSIELVRDRITKEPADNETAWMHQTLANEGLMCISSGPYYNRLCFAPPLVIKREEIDQAIDKLDRVLFAAEDRFANS